MLRVKIFENDNIDELQKKINGFLQSGQIIVRNMKITSIALTPEDQEPVWHTVLIQYETGFNFKN